MDEGLSTNAGAAPALGYAEIDERSLVKAMSWWDGLMIALADPGFLLAALGGSIGALGTLGAMIVWTGSVLLGALQNNIYAEWRPCSGQVRGHRGVRTRRLATLLRTGGASGHVRLLVRLVHGPTPSAD